MQCVCEFCDHRIDVFSTFRGNFNFLPGEFREKGEEVKWIKFFCKLGLRQSITKEEYLQLCRQTENGMQHDTEKSSSVLLRYLLRCESSAKCPAEWYRDSEFLSQISHIRFVCTVKLPELEWIVNSYITSGSGTLALTTLQDATVIDNKMLLWTVKPITNIQCGDSGRFLEPLHVIVTPSVSDVIANMTNIIHSKFAKSALLDKYPVECNQPNDCISVIDVMLHNFEFLKNHYPTTEQLRQLSDSHSIPVHAHPKAETDNFVVLMKPHCVLTTRDAEEYFPFLHKLPAKFNSVAALLEQIGVKSSLELQHFKIILEKAYQSSNGFELDPTSTEVTQRAIRGLYSMLKEKRRQTSSKQMSADEIYKELNPLYLPTTEGKLHLSTSLLYRDLSYESIDIDLSSTELCILNIPKTLYGFNEEELCSQLPDNIKPRQISECCIQRVLSDSSVVMESQIAEEIRASFSLPTLPEVLLLIIRQVTKDASICTAFKSILIDFLKHFQIQVIRDLQASIILKIVEPHDVIGCAKVSYHLQQSNDGKTIVLSLDSKISKIPKKLALTAVAKYLISAIKPFCSTAETISALSELNGYFVMAFESESREDHNNILEDFEGNLSLEATDITFEATMKPQLGKPVPESWHHRLDQNTSNLFHSEEWVGYEETDDHIIFAQIVCPMLPEGRAPSAMLMKYTITIKEDDEEGIVVSALQLFKFLKSPHERSEAEAVEVIDVYKGVPSAKVRKEKISETLKDVKKQLCKELLIIWKLSQTERKQALKRLYLKWHPDKNSDDADFAEEVFKYLQRQIDRLEKDLPLEDPEEDDAERSQYPGKGFWSTYYGKWNATAGRHRQSNHSEEQYYGGRRRGREGSTSSGTASSTSFFDFPTRPSPDVPEGRRWLKQARIDYEVMNEQITLTQRYAGHICFMAHQVAEKALKGGKYIVCGLGQNSLKNHNLTNHAYALQAEKPVKLAGLSTYSAPLEHYYLNTRYPNRVSPPQIPSDMYSMKEADAAKHNAKKILTMMESLV